jgi:hypothetical protein
MRTTATVLGFPVVVDNTRAEIATAEVLARLEAALGLVARWAPRRFRRLRRDVAGFVVERFPCRAAFFPRERACLVELTFTVNPAHGLGEVASSIVHEGVHARVHATLPGRPEGWLGREERLCREAELEFAAALPPALGAVPLARARALLALSGEELAPRIAWDEAMARVRAVDGGHG